MAFVATIAQGQERSQDHWINEVRRSMAAYHSVFSGSFPSQHQNTQHLLPGTGKKYSDSTPCIDTSRYSSSCHKQVSLGELGDGQIWGSHS